MTPKVALMKDTPHMVPDRRFNTSEFEVIKEGDQLTLRPRGKDWAAWFDGKSGGCLPAREQPILDERNEMP